MDPLNIGYDRNRYPAGQQDFATLRQGNMLYVDKTSYVYELTRQSYNYFLSRPRRFGKSLLLSTIEAYFQGRRELFKGLAIEDLEHEWIEHPVIRIDMSKGSFQSVSELCELIDTQLIFIAEKLGVSLERHDITSRLQELIKRSYDKYGQKVVVLIDEYDKPILETKYEVQETHDVVQDLMRGFYGSLKGNAEYLRFVMLTGITKVSHVNIFSGLNNLTDISLQPWCNALCGISESELQQYFVEDIATFAKINSMSIDDVKSQFKRYYDGYRFAEYGENIYNPYSVVLAFQNMKFSDYWFVTGTPTHLIKSLKNENFDFDGLEGYAADQNELMGIATTDGNPIGLLYQSGYLTIKDYTDELYILGFPNKEVESGFYDILLQVLYPTATSSGYSALNVRKEALRGMPHKLVELLDKALFDYNYNQHKDIDGEAILNSLLYGLVHAIGLNVKAEYHISNGRIDMVIETKRYIYLFEFKVDKTAAAAMKQIDDVGYANHFKYDQRKLFKIGLNYNTKLRRIDDVVIV